MTNDDTAPAGDVPTAARQARRARTKRVAITLLLAAVAILTGGWLIAHGLATAFLKPACAEYGLARGMTPIGYELNNRRASKNRRGASHYCTYVHPAGGETRVRIAKLGWQWSLFSIPLSPAVNATVLAALAVLVWYLKLRKPGRTG